MFQLFQNISESIVRTSEIEQTIGKLWIMCAMGIGLKGACFPTPLIPSLCHTVKGFHL